MCYACAKKLAGTSEGSPEEPTEKDDTDRKGVLDRDSDATSGKIQFLFRYKKLFYSITFNHS